MEKLTIKESKQLKELYKRFNDMLSGYALPAVVETSEALYKVQQLMDTYLPTEKE